MVQKKLFLRMILQCALSAHKLYKMNGGRLDFLHFLLQVCNELLSKSPKMNQNVQKIDNLSLPGKRPYEGKGSDKFGESEAMQSLLCKRFAYS